MEPGTAIIWVCVAVFAATAIITVLDLAGVIRTRYSKILFQALIVQVVAAGVYIFVKEIKRPVDTENKLPVSKLMIVEQAPVLTVFDGDTPIYLRSPDVSRAQRVVDLAIDLRNDFTSAVRARITVGEVQTVSVGNRRFRVAVTQLGQLDADPNEPQAPTGDFAFLSIERQQ
jgi:hypothetical protein